MLENIERIASYVAGMAQDEFQRDGRTRDAVERCLERICEAAFRLGERERTGWMRRWRPHGRDVQCALRIELGGMIIDDQGTGGGIKIPAGIGMADFIKAANNAHIRFRREDSDTIKLCNGFYARFLHFEDGRPDQVEN